jgi:hypothetical protein
LDFFCPLFREWRHGLCLDVVQETIRDRPSRGRVAQKLDPFLPGPVAGQDVQTFPKPWPRIALRRACFKNYILQKETKHVDLGIR